mgnify:CR=1 FL=1
MQNYRVVPQTKRGNSTWNFYSSNEFKDTNSRTRIQGHEFKDTNSRTRIQGHEFKDTNSRTQIQGYKFKDTNSRTRIQGHKFKDTNSRTLSHTPSMCLLQHNRVIVSCFI